MGLPRWIERYISDYNFENDVDEGPVEATPVANRSMISEPGVYYIENEDVITVRLE